MRAYIRIFLNLLMPISLLITLGAIAYLSLDYNFSKAMKLGFLLGILIGFPISIVAAFILLIKRKNGPIPEKSEQTVKSTDTEASSSNSKIPVEQKLMLLMDKKLAFNVALFSIMDQNLGDTVTKESKEKSTITLRTYNETIQIITTALTRHTAQILIKAENSSQELSKIISYIKEKEHSFLQH